MQTTEDRLKTALWLDDNRTPVNPIPGYKMWDVVRNYKEFEEYIVINGLPDFISFDHDLAEEHVIDHATQVSKMGWQSPDYENYQEKTGLDCAKFLVEYIQNSKLDHFPKCSVHSHNPVGAQNIQGYINGFLRHMGWEENCYIGKHAFVIAEKDEKSI